jgi:hypothetical protein
MSKVLERPVRAATCNSGHYLNGRNPGRSCRRRNGGIAPIAVVPPTVWICAVGLAFTSTSPCRFGARGARSLVLGRERVYELAGERA